jgi:hypothetical protein
VNVVNVNGGDAGDSGTGGEGGNGGRRGGVGGAGGLGQVGSRAGSINHRITVGGGSSSNLISGASAVGGDGGDGGTGGNGGSGDILNGGNGGAGRNGGNGGTGGSMIQLTAGGGTSILVSPDNSGGNGGLGGQGGTGGVGIPNGADGPDGDNGNPGADGPPPQQLTEDTDEENPLKRKGAKMRMIASNNNLKPVAFVQPLLELADRVVPASNVILAPKDGDHIAKAGGARIHVAKGSAAFVINNGRDVMVLSLHDGNNGDVSVLVGGQEISLRAGEQALITAASSSFAEANMLSRVAVRGGSEHALENGSRLLISEFSIPSAIAAVPALKKLAEGDSHQRGVYGKIMKNAAALHMLMMQKGPYKPMAGTDKLASAR